MQHSTYYKNLREDWKTAAEQVTDRFEADHVSHNDLRNEILTVVDYALEQTCTTWKPGKPCPDCDSDQLTRWVSYAELTKHDNGCTSIHDGSNNSIVFAWTCDDCEGTIALSPASLFTSASPGEYPNETAIQDLIDGLETQVTSTNWDPGTPCLYCDSHMIGEQPLDAYGTTAFGNGYEQASYGERIATPEYWCDSCGETLLQDQGSILMRELSL